MDASENYHRDYYELFYANKLKNLKETEKFP